MGYAVSGLTTGMTGDVGSGLVPGLKGYGASNRLPAEGKKDSNKQREMRENNCRHRNADSQTDQLSKTPEATGE